MGWVNCWGSLRWAVLGVGEKVVGWGRGAGGREMAVCWKGHGAGGIARVAGRRLGPAGGVGVGTMAVGPGV